MHIFEIMNQYLYIDMLQNGYIRENSHPTLGLRIINYTEKAQYENEWNEVTRQCRGLIVDPQGHIVARPFDKFLNYGQDEADKLLMDQQVIATDKMDGSLGILWQYGDEIGISTRGSFISDQAVFATRLLHDKYTIDFDPMWTYMFEIIYPENRIVLDYGDMQDLVLLGARHIKSGFVRLPESLSSWKGPKTKTFPYKTLREALSAPQRHNAEGLVVYFPGLDYRIKIKQDDYIALHKIVTGLTERRVWENMKEGKTFEELCEIVPDEWHKWLWETYDSLDAAFNLQENKISLAYSAIKWSLPEDFTRKEFAIKAVKTEYPGFMFDMLDGKDTSDKIWDLIRPSAE